MLYKIELIDASGDFSYVIGKSPKNAIKKMLKISRSSQKIIEEKDNFFITTNNWKYKVTEIDSAQQLKEHISMLDAGDLHDFACDICYTAFGSDVTEDQICNIINALEKYTFDSLPISS